MPRVAKTKQVWVVQQKWGYGHGWEDVSEEDTYKEARARLKEYRDNQPEAPARLISRREKLAEQTTNPRDLNKLVKRNPMPVLLKSGTKRIKAIAKRVGKTVKVFVTRDVLRKNPHLRSRVVKPEVIHTACKFCGLDIEGVRPFKAGEWRDRGNNTRCPGKNGRMWGRKHAPNKD